jgi:hypothetical protein
VPFEIRSTLSEGPAALLVAFRTPAIRAEAPERARPCRPLRLVYHISIGGYTEVDALFCTGLQGESAGRPARRGIRGPSGSWRGGDHGPRHR